MDHTWAQLKLYHKSYSTIIFHRDKAQENAYNILRKEQGIQLSNYVFKLLFTHDQWIPFRLVKCNFPYQLSPGIEHWNLWLNPMMPYHHYQIIDYDQIIDLYLNYYQPLKKYKEYIYFENIPANRSVNSVRHMHVFFR